MAQLPIVINHLYFSEKIVFTYYNIKVLAIFIRPRSDHSPPMSVTNHLIEN